MFSTNRKGAGYYHLSTSGAGKPRPSKALMYSQNRRLYSRGREADEDHDRWAALGVWFLGPKAENGDLFKDLLTKAVDSQIGFRHR